MASDEEDAEHQRRINAALAFNPVLKPLSSSSTAKPRSVRASLYEDEDNPVIAAEDEQFQKHATRKLHAHLEAILDDEGEVVRQPVRPRKAFDDESKFQIFSSSRHVPQSQSQEPAPVKNKRPTIKRRREIKRDDNSSDDDKEEAQRLKDAATVAISTDDVLREAVQLKRIKSTETS